MASHSSVLAWRIPGTDAAKLLFSPFHTFVRNESKVQSTIPHSGMNSNKEFVESMLKPPQLQALSFYCASQILCFFTNQRFVQS